MREGNAIAKSSIKDMMERIKERTLPTVIDTAALDEVIDAFERSRHSRILYAVDADNKFLGIIDVKDISKHVLFHYHEQGLDSRELIRIVTSESAKDFIKKEKCSALMEEDYERVLERMLKSRADEIPILSEKGEILGDITIIDMIEYYVYKTGRDKLGIQP
jgi:CBS domain containing-hemolysin-like protein